MNGRELIENIIAELEKAKEILHENINNSPIDTISDEYNLINDINSDLERYYDYSKEISTATETIIVQ